MLYPVWTAKPGSGCTTVCVALGAQLSQRHEHGVLFVDLGGDLAAALGLAETGPGVTDWLAATAADPAALARLEVSVPGEGLALLPLGSAVDWPTERSEVLVELLGHDQRAIVIDGSTLREDSATALDDLRARCIAAGSSTMVTRPCYLALRRAVGLGTRPDGIAVVREVGRSLDRTDISEILGVEVVAEIDHDPAVARALDAGLLVRRCPRLLARQVGAMLR